jgi:ATP-binding cassette subfamily B protein
VILDEATSSLDTPSEALIQKALKNLLTGRTSIIIAHRLSTVVDCDQIVVMEQGQILQKGSHKELIADPSGKYFQLCQKQFGIRETTKSIDTAMAQPASITDIHSLNPESQWLDPSRRLS